MPCPSDCSLAQMAAMSPLQLMRAVIAALASPATFAKGLVMARRQPDAAAAQLPPLSSASAFRQHHPSCLWTPAATSTWQSMCSAAASLRFTQTPGGSYSINSVLAWKCMLPALHASNVSPCNWQETN